MTGGLVSTDQIGLLWTETSSIAAAFMFVRGPAHGIIPDAANPVFTSVSFRRRDPKGLC